MPLELIHLTSLEGLRAAAADWDDLWRRSEVTLPTSRAEPLAIWLDHFARHARFEALGVAEDGRWLAALPLVAKRLARIFEAGSLPNSPWSPAGELLIDQSVNIGPVLETLVGGLSRLPWQVLWLNGAITDSARWREFLAACERGGLGTHVQEQQRLGFTPRGESWEEFEKNLSRNHRQNMRKHARRIERDGEVRLVVVDNLQQDEIEGVLRRSFEVEDRNWKGRAGTSVLGTPGMFDFYCRQAAAAAAHGELRVCMLEFDGRPIASEYAFRAKGVYHCFKVGYDDAFAAYSPGQLLRYYLFRRLHEDPDWRYTDWMGPLTEAFGKWTGTTTAVGRVVVAQPRLLARTLLHAYKHWWPAVRRWRDVVRSPRDGRKKAPTPSPNAAAEHADA
jgi:CelD/BcsL family acetyltransferase involved in cellulose biosynthesis